MKSAAGTQPSDNGRISVEQAPHLVPGVRAWTTRRDAGTFGLGGTDAVGDVVGRWALLQDELSKPNLISELRKEIRGIKKGA